MALSSSLKYSLFFFSLSFKDRREETNLFPKKRADIVVGRESRIS
jgi:hypothetical protein